MTDAEILALLKTDLGEQFASTDRLAFLNQSIQSAKAFIAREGITLTDSLEDAQLIEMYAAFLVRKRNTPDGMPRSLRWALNNRLMSQKAGG